MTPEPTTMTPQRREAERIAADLYAIRSRIAKRHGYGVAEIPWHQLAPFTRSYEIDVVEQALAEEVIRP